MFDMQGPELSLSSSERYVKCRSEIEAAMMRLIEAAQKLGWTEIEVTMALADASEDHVLKIARFERSH